MGIAHPYLIQVHEKLHFLNLSDGYIFLNQRRKLVGWLCFTSHRQRDHLEMAPPFTVPCEGCKARLYTVPTGNRTLARRVAVQYTTAAPCQFH